jgi:hypothetical protein
MRLNLLTTLATAALIGQSAAGPAAYGICQAGCGVLAGACYTAAGFVFGTVAAIAAPPAIVGCNSAFGVCSAKCAVVALLPTP